MQQPSYKLYILVDKTLSSSQQAVQACHASIEFAKKYPEWKHQSLVLLGINGEAALDLWKWKLQRYQQAAFYESFWDNRLTAIATYGCDELVKELPLL